jgi:ribA/ribD-fused uncharacterized protein
MNHTNGPITRFHGTYFFLSNFYPSLVTFQNKQYRSAEHAFQSAKPVSEHDALLIRRARTPAYAKVLGRRVLLRPDWEEVKDGIMHDILVAKFAPGTHLAVRLINTGERHLEERNSWGDAYWGTVNGRGKNRLGTLLMDIRTNLKEQHVEEQP